MKKKGLAILLALCLGVTGMGSIGSQAVEIRTDNQGNGVIGEQTDTEEDSQTVTKDEADSGEAVTESQEADEATDANVSELETPEAEESSAQADAGFYGETTVDETNVPVIDEEGNITYVDMSDDDTVVGENQKTRAAAQIVNFRKTSGVIEYTEVGTKAEGYTAGAYGADGAYLGTSGGYVKFMLGGVIGQVASSKVEVLSKSSTKSLSYYMVKNGRLYHYISTNVKTAGNSSSLDNGPAPSYLAGGTKYYSYDGHYFYTEANFGNMLDDYKNETRTHSVNAGKPFYNYYQYLPLRSQSNYSGSTLNSIINGKVASSSKLKNTGNDFVTNQNTYGVNALLIMGLAVNESAWGTSNISQTKNNLFGLNAVDSSPGQSANYFASVNQCIKEFTEKWMSKEYLNPNNWKYFGGFLGNKASGANVKYASDPYWGEKAAAFAWQLDSLGGNKDSGKYTIGIKDTIGPDNTVNIRKENTTSSAALYKTPKQGNVAYLILNSTPTNKFYKIQSDGVLNSGRTALDGSTGKYSFSNMYAYISSDYVKIVSSGSGGQITNWSVNGIKTSVSSPQPVNTKVQLSANISGDSSKLKYKFVWQKNSWKEWGVIQDFSSSSKVDWTPKAEGNYEIYMDVKDTDGKTVSVHTQFRVLGWSYSGITVNPGSPGILNSQIKILANISGDTKSLKYKFVWQKDNWKKWGVIQDFSSKNSCTWKPGEIGEYTLCVDVKDSSGYTVTKTKTYSVTSKTWEPSTLKFEPGTVTIGENVKLTQNIKDSSGNKVSLQYKFVWMKDDWKEWGVIQEFSSKNSASWKPEVVGKCNIYVDVKDSAGNKVTQVTSCNVQKGTWKFNGITSDKQSSQKVGEKAKLTADMQGNTAGLQYKFVWQKDNWKEWGVIGGFSAKNSVEWIPNQSGTYQILVDIRDYTGTTTTYNKSFIVTDAVFDSIKITPDGTQNVGGKINIKAVFQGTPSNIQYKFVWQKDNWKDWGVIQPLSSKNNADWIPEKVGKYTLYVDMKQGNGSTVTKTETVSVGQWNFSKVNISKKASGKYHIQPFVSGNVSGFTYKYVWMKNNWKEWGVISQFSSSTSVDWIPQGSGKYSVYVDVKDAAGNVVTQNCVYTIK